MKRLVRNASFLKALQRAKTNKSKLKKLVGGANSSQICSLCEITKNVYRGRLQASPRVKAKLCKYKRIIRKLLNKSTGYQAKKKLLQQSDTKKQKGGLPLIPILMSLAGPLIGKLISGFTSK